MRTFDLVRIAAKNLRGRWALLPVLCMAVSMFCLSFAGTVFVTVREEKSLPYELSVMSESSEISNNTIAQILQIADVSAVTPILNVPMNVRVDEHFTQLTLVGLNSSYLVEGVAHGVLFPESSVMPYIVLNQEACKQFDDSDGNDDSETEQPQIDWLSADASVQMGEESRPVAAKISGILTGNEEQEPAAYISLFSAKQLLEKSGQSTEHIEAKVRVKNIGCAEKVSRAIHSLGLNVINGNSDLQAGWDMRMKEMDYLIVVGILCLLCSAALSAAWIKISLLEQKNEYNAFKWLGVKRSEIRGMFAVQTLLILLIGIGIGIIAGASLPSFISLELAGSSIFALHIPINVCLLVAAVLITFSMIASLVIIKCTESNLH